MLPDELATMPNGIESMFYDLQNRLLNDIVLKVQRANGITSTADYEINKLSQLGASDQFIRDEVQRISGYTDAQIDRIYHDAAEMDYVRNKDLYEKITGSFIPYGENGALQQWVNGIIEQTQGDLKNITKTMGFTVFFNGLKQFMPIADVYQKYVDAACLDVVTGSFDYTTVIKRCVNQLSRSGLRCVPYASGHVNRAPVAARRAVMTGANQIAARMTEEIGRDLNCEYYEVTAHVDARPSHAEWQGQVYKIHGHDREHQNFYEMTGYGSGGGLCGWNCRHNFYPFFPEYSVRAYTDKHLQYLKDETNKVRTFDGVGYSGYEATQRQRQYETVMRAQREEIALLKLGGASKADITAARSRYRTTMNEYNNFSEAMGKYTQYERVYLDGLGRVL